MDNLSVFHNALDVEGFLEKMQTYSNYESIKQEVQDVRNQVQTGITKFVDLTEKFKSGSSEAIQQEIQDNYWKEYRKDPIKQHKIFYVAPGDYILDGPILIHNCDFFCFGNIIGPTHTIKTFDETWTWAAQLANESNNMLRDSVASALVNFNGTDLKWYIKKITVRNNYTGCYIYSTTGCNLRIDRITGDYNSSINATHKIEVIENGNKVTKETSCKYIPDNWHLNAGFMANHITSSNISFGIIDNLNYGILFQETIPRVIHNPAVKTVYRKNENGSTSKIELNSSTKDYYFVPGKYYTDSNCQNIWLSDRLSKYGGYAGDIVPSGQYYIPVNARHIEIMCSIFTIQSIVCKQGINFNLKNRIDWQGKGTTTINTNTVFNVNGDDDNNIHGNIFTIGTFSGFKNGQISNGLDTRGTINDSAMSQRFMFNLNGGDIHYYRQCQMANNVFSIGYVQGPYDGFIKGVNIAGLNWKGYIQVNDLYRSGSATSGAKRKVLEDGDPYIIEFTNSYNNSFENVGNSFIRASEIKVSNTCKNITINTVLDDKIYTQIDEKEKPNDKYHRLKAENIDIVETRIYDKGEIYKKNQKTGFVK